MTPQLLATTDLPEAVRVVGRLVAAGLEPIGSAPGPDGEEAALRGFTGRAGQVLVHSGADGVVAYVGVGDRSALTPPAVRAAAAAFARAVSPAPQVALDLRGLDDGDLDPRRVAHAVVEGVSGATTRVGRYRSTRDEPRTEAVHLLVDEESLATTVHGLERGRAVAAAVEFARDQVNRSAGDLTPRVLAEEAERLAAASGLSIDVVDEVRAAELGLGGLLGVARGSAEPPRLVTLTYEPPAELARTRADGTVPTVVLVGKGITFDSGGLSLKTADGMKTMKSDMSGAASVIAVACACPALGVGVRVVAIAPLTENMPGGRATKPGDVLTARNGKTIEVLDTDAEGRLVLADGLSLAAEAEPDAIVDIATLTGGCVVALGKKVAGLMGNDSAVLAALERSAAATGEPVWRLPLPRDYRRSLDSEVADLKNIGVPRIASPVMAGLFLQEFVADRPWGHLDIAGPSFTDEDAFEYRKGATAFGVRLLIDFVEQFEPTGRPVADHEGVGT